MPDLQDVVKRALEFCENGVMPRDGVNMLRRAVYGEDQEKAPCSQCDGTGKFGIVKCPRCQGEGLV